ncbi:hypothetical protein H5410_002034 [Solanum commersonii]|uniref:Uncharacterized protein n=1 Tax=Solanum commersonii TaxID=4109 RepID=A0A9J6B0H9_SOLCO|nr:hypothetical protein H5410_002034 [Solanum commersonii]
MDGRCGHRPLQAVVYGGLSRNLWRVKERTNYKVGNGEKIAFGMTFGVGEALKHAFVLHSPSQGQASMASHGRDKGGTSGERESSSVKSAYERTESLEEQHAGWPRRMIRRTKFPTR